MPHPANSACHLTLILPGLIWPQQAMHDLTRDLPTPALSFLLGKAKLIRDDGDTHAWLRNAFGLADNPAAGPLRYLGLTGATATQRCLCIDPVNFLFADRKITVGKPEDMQLTELEAQALSEALSPTFRDIGEMTVTTPMQWHLLLHDSVAPLPLFPPLPDFVGQRADQGLPADPQWRYLINEAQVLLHAHPVNEAREARGLPRINSIWPWGGGALVTKVKTQHDIVFSDDEVLRGLTKLCQLELNGSPDAWQALPHHQPLITLDHLAAPRNQGDGLRWRDSLAALESNWFAPLLGALRSGAVQHLTVVLPDVDHGCRLEVSRLSVLKFWRRPAPLTMLTA